MKNLLKRLLGVKEFCNVRKKISTSKNSGDEKLSKYYIPSYAFFLYSITSSFMISKIVTLALSTAFMLLDIVSKEDGEKK